MVAVTEPVTDQLVSTPLFVIVDEPIVSAEEVTWLNCTFDVVPTDWGNEIWWLTATEPSNASPSSVIFIPNPLDIENAFASVIPGDSDGPDVPNVSIDSPPSPVSNKVVDVSVPIMNWLGVKWVICVWGPANSLYASGIKYPFNVTLNSVLINLSLSVTSVMSV